MKFPGFSTRDAKLFNSVMSAVIRDIIANDLAVTPEEVAERFAQATLAGERSFERLKALMLGAEKAQANSQVN